MAEQSMRHGGRRVLVTGADRGIGRAVAERLASEGARIWLNTLQPPDPGLLAEMRAAGAADVEALRADLERPAEIGALFAAVRRSWGGLDVLINNAGVDTVSPAIDLAVEEWDRVLDINLRGAFLCAQQAARLMRAEGRGGVILNISSIHDSVPRLGTAHYCASKAGLTMLTRALAVEWAELGIRVVGLAPGAIETTLNRGQIEAVGRERFEGWIPAGRLGTTDDIAAAVSFLASGEAGYLAGATLVIDGAYSLNTIRYDPRAGEESGQR